MINLKLRRNESFEQRGERLSRQMRPDALLLIDTTRSQFGTDYGRAIVRANCVRKWRNGKAGGYNLVCQIIAAENGVYGRDMNREGFKFDLRAFEGTSQWTMVELPWEDLFLHISMKFTSPLFHKIIEEGPRARA